MPYTIEADACFMLALRGDSPGRIKDICTLNFAALTGFSPFKCSCHLFSPSVPLSCRKILKAVKVHGRRKESVCRALFHEYTFAACPNKTANSIPIQTFQNQDVPPFFELPKDMRGRATIHNMPQKGSTFESGQVSAWPSNQYRAISRHLARSLGPHSNSMSSPPISRKHVGHVR